MRAGSYPRFTLFTATGYPAAGDIGNNIAVGDINNDGRADIVVSLSYRVMVLLSRPDGTFADGVFYDVGTNLTMAVLGDVNGDGNADLIVTKGKPYPPASTDACDNNLAGCQTVNANNVSILLGDGAGGFGPPKNLQAGEDPAALVVSDFDLDGKLDVAVANADSNDVSILRGNGDGTFAPAVYLPVGTAPSFLAAADFNNDGKPDLAVADRESDNISVLLGNGSGGFASSIDSAAGRQPASFVAGDLNGDGKTDLAVINYTNRNGVVTDLSLLLGNGDGTFSAPTIVISGDIHSAVISDMDLDGKSDLVVAVSRSACCEANVTVLLGSGNGTFAAARSFRTGEDARNIAAYDFDQDGKPDVAAATASGYVMIFPGNGDGTLTTYGAGAYLVALALGDFNSDNKTDVVANSAILLGNGGGRFAPAIGYGVPGQSLQSVTVGDFNRDGKIDLAGVAETGEKVSIFLGTGNAGFAAPSEYALVGRSSGVAKGDFDGNGIEDLVVTSYERGRLTVLLGNGSGTFSSAGNYEAGPSPSSVAVADFDGDGKQDLVLTVASSRFVGDNAYFLAFLRGGGNGSFALPAYISAGTTPVWSAIAQDFGGDGKIDVVVANGQGILVFHGQGNGTFASPVNYALGKRPRALAAADLNGDGKFDLATANTDVTNVSVVLGNGDDTFGAPISFAVGAQPSSIAAGDLNGDGKQDLVTSNDNGTVSVLLNAGNGVAAINSIVPVRGPVAGGQSVTLGGLGFDSASGVTFGGVAATITSQTSTSITAVSPGHSAGLVDVVVTAGTGSATMSRAYSYVAAPTINSIAPGFVMMGGGLVRLAGANFYAPISVTVGGSAATAGESASNSLMFMAPTLTTPGAKDVVVTTAGGSATTTLTYRQIPPTDPTCPGYAGITTTSIGTVPAAIAASDFNGDGLSDVAVVAYQLDQILMLLGTGHGAFQPAVPYSPGIHPFALAAGDFNGDGRKDLAVLSQAWNNVSILPGRGDGTFGSTLLCDRVNQPTHLAVGDVDNDGKQDLIVATADGLLLLRGNGNGTFASPATIAAVEAWRIAAADLNGDGKLDLIATRYATALVLLGHGDGTFARWVEYDAGPSTRAISIVDLNGDSMPDLAVLYWCGEFWDYSTPPCARGVAVLLNRGDGTFAPAVSWSVRHFPYDLVAGDFNGDGKADLAVSNMGSIFAAGISILRGAGDGTFALSDPYPVPTIPATNNVPFSLAVGDFNGDGKADLVTGNIALNSVSVLMNTCGSAPSITSISPGSGPASGGQTITIRGSNLGGAISVTFGGAPGMITGNTATSITVVAPAHAPGVVDIVVVTPAGSTTFPSAFSYAAAIADVPTISTFMLIALGATLALIAASRMRS
jgi:trimeric autotransporter adhesin